MIIMRYGHIFKITNESTVFALMWHIDSWKMPIYLSVLAHNNS